MSPTDRRIRVLIVDDSALIRKLLADLLRTSPEVEVVGFARDGEEAIAEVIRLRPDVVTLDVNMPGRTGLEILPELLAAHPVSVLMVSALTQEGADVTLAALERGAIDFLPKPDRNQLSQLREAREQLIGKVLGAASARPARRSSPRSTTPPAPEPPSAIAHRPQSESKSDSAETDLDLRTVAAAAACVVLGISTGGPQALGAVLPLVNPPIPPVLIVQHMPATFTTVFAERLNRTCSVVVKEAEEGDKLSPNRILIAPGGRHMTLIGNASSCRVKLNDSPPVSGHRPSVDVLFAAAAKIYGGALVGIIMTGMGRDGVEGCKAILEAGGKTYGQDEATSAVYGMNKIAFQERAVRVQFALEDLPALFRKFARGMDRGA
ncbi:MAG: chemotaxis response regulator protein-glutamate methylesterase [Isosphaeraceae bacterium]